MIPVNAGTDKIRSFKFNKNVDREKQSRDYKNVWCIKNEDRRVLMKGTEMMRRWKEYFEGLLNEEFPREAVNRVEWNMGMVDLIREEEVWSAVRKMKNKKVVGPEGEGLFDYIHVGEMQRLVEDHLTKNPRFSNHGQRIVHFILYLNTDLENCNWIKTDKSLNLSQYVHGKPIATYIYYRLVEILNLQPYVTETIMCTPYSFCRDIVGTILCRMKSMEGFQQLKETENLVIALLKSVKRAPVNSTLENPLTAQLNTALMIFDVDNLPKDIQKFGELGKKNLTRFTGDRVKSIFKILNEIIRFTSIPDTYREYALYKLKSIRHHDVDMEMENVMFNKLLDIVMHKCVEMCDFSIETWLSWYEVEVIEEDTNLQATIGHQCYDLCSFIDNGYVNGTSIIDYRPILGNIAIKKVDFTNANIEDITSMILTLENCPKFHINDWIKKTVENPEVFINSRAIEVFHMNIESIDFNCFKCLIDHCLPYYKSGGTMLDSMGEVLYKGIKSLDMVDKMSFLDHININYADNTFHFTHEFDEELKYIVENEFNPRFDKNELLSKAIWLILQQPRKVLHLLIKQYVTGIYGLPFKSFTEDRRGFLHAILVDTHLQMNACYIYFEYNSWLDFKSELGLDEKNRLNAWIFGATKVMFLIKPKLFLANVIAPLLSPSPNYEHMLFLVELTKFFLAECQLVALPDMDVWDNLLIQLAKVLDDARWSMENYTYVRVQLCEKIIVTIQPLLQYASFIVKPKDLDSIKQELSNLHLMTRSHFLRMWSARYITIDGMDEQFIMTVQSQSHISFSNLNGSSHQLAQEEFIFSIATYMPKFTLHEMKSFLANYLHSAKPPKLVEASYFLLDCVMNALMRIVVYLKTSVQTEPDVRERSLKYVDNVITFFFDAANVSKMASIYDREVDGKVAFNSLGKIIMVLKQLNNDSQPPLLCIVRRITSTIVTKLDNEFISKLLALIASIKTNNSKDMLKDTVEELIKQLNTNSTNLKCNQ